MKKSNITLSKKPTYKGALFCLFLLLHLMAMPVQAQSYSDKLDEYLNAHFKQGVFSGTVVITEKDKVVYSHGFGMSDYDKEIANGADTKFRFGSITKSFTATLILQLQEKGKLNVQDKVEKYLPDFPNGDKITLHHLLTHTSGLANYTDFWQEVNTIPTTGAEILPLFKDKPLAFEPGTKFSYCNSGYVLLGLIIEKVTGKTYEQVLTKNILKPLKMKTAGLEGGGKPVPGLAVGYNYNGSTRKQSKPIDMSWCWAAGGLYGTAADLAKWDQGLKGNKLLSAASKKMMYTPFKNDYGYGSVIDTVFNQPRVAYSGAINGFKASFIRLTDKEVTIAVLSNYESQQVNGPIAKDVTAIVLGEKYEVPVVHNIISLTTEQLTGYTGEYQVAPKFIFKITLEDGQLYAEGPGQDKFEIFPKAQDEFFVKVAPALVSFERDDKGNISKMLLKHGGRAMPAMRLN